MTPGARVAAAIEILDTFREGKPVEQVLTRWARTNRFAGSKDRAAIRDHVYGVIRHWRSDAIRGGGETGRARMIGRLRAEGVSLDAVFDGVGHSPPPLKEIERSAGATPVKKGDVWDLPDWLLSSFEDSLGTAAKHTALSLTGRAPVTLRVNARQETRSDVLRALVEDGISTVINPRASTALTVVAGARRIRNSEVYKSGLVELQDASSQAAVERVAGTGSVLDFCAGGGGKALALEALGWRVTAHDLAAARMRDLPARAARGGHNITFCPPEELTAAETFDAVFCDAPCSGSGTWRRSPAAKWHLTHDRLVALKATQAQVLDTATHHITRDGTLYYATCSVLKEENETQIDAFCARHPDWQCTEMIRWPVDEWGDGFFLATLTR